MEEWEREAQRDMLEIDRLLSKFWVDGWISSETKQKIWNEFPSRLKSIIYQK